MAKINFTKEHADRLKELSVSALFSGMTIDTSMGQTLGISELIHTTTINTLTNIRNGLTKQIETKEGADEWTVSDSEQRKLDILKEKKELVNLIIGYKRHLEEIREENKKRNDLRKKIAELKDSQKTPDDRIKEMEAELATMNSTTEF